MHKANHMGAGLNKFSRAIVLAVLLLAGCGPEAKKPPIRVSSSYWIGYEPFYTAEAVGLLDPATIHMVETPTSLTLDQTLQGDTIDAVAVSLTRALYYLETNHKLTIVLVLDWSNGADQILARPDIKTIADLAGKKVGTERNTVNTYLLMRALQQHNLTKDDIELYYDTNELLTDAYSNQPLAAASVYGRPLTQLIQMGAQSIYDSTQIPGEIIDVIMVRDKYLQDNPDRVQQLVAAWFDAVDYMQTPLEQENAKSYLLFDEDFNAGKNDIRYANFEDNLGFLENDGKKLREIIRKRYEIRALLDGGTGPSSPHIQVDTRPFEHVRSTRQKLE